MIDPNELRIGNRVLVDRFNDDEPWETIVEEIEPYQITVALIPRGGTWVKPDDIYPIPISPEFLESIGFVKDMGGGGGLLEFENGFICFYDLDKPLVSFSDKMATGAPMPNLKYVHQLQNLYHSLTGEEITIKEKV